MKKIKFINMIKGAISIHNIRLTYGSPSATVACLAKMLFACYRGRAKSRMLAHSTHDMHSAARACVNSSRLACETVSSRKSRFSLCKPHVVVSTHHFDEARPKSVSPHAAHGQVQKPWVAQEEEVLRTKAHETLYSPRNAIYKYVVLCETFCLT